MPLSQAEEDVLAGVYRNFQEKPIEPGDPFYVKIWEHSGHDPVERLRKHIAWSEVQSLQLFSGYSGSGKSTQLRRLRQELAGKGYLVLYADAQDYLSLAEPIEIEELLIVIAGAFSDCLDGKLLNDSYWSRLINFLGNTDVELKEITLKHSAASFKFELKSSPTFRQRIRTLVQSKLPEVQRSIERFIQEAVEAADRRNPGQRIVFLFDSFEKLHGTPSNAPAVMDSVEKLFGAHLESLKLPFVHCVYSVPAFVQRLVPSCEVVILPTVKLWKRREQGAAEVRYEPGWRAMREIIEKRFQGSNSSLLGDVDQDGNYPVAESLIEASGGGLRELLRLFREALLAAQSLPLSTEIARKAIANISNDFKTSVEDARWLHRIHAEQSVDLPSSGAEDIRRYMRLLDSHLLLYYRNEKDWFDTHPLVRQEVDRIVAQNPEPLPGSQG